MHEDDGAVVVVARQAVRAVRHDLGGAVFDARPVAGDAPVLGVDAPIHRHGDVATRIGHVLEELPAPELAIGRAEHGGLNARRLLNEVERLRNLALAGGCVHTRQRAVVVRVGVACNLMAGVTHTLGHLRVLLARSQGRAKHEERRLCAVSSKDVEVLRGVVEVGAVVERDGDQTATVVGVHAGVGDDEVARLLRHAAVDGATRHNARLHRGDAVLAPLLHIADGGKQQARIGHLNAAGNLGRLLRNVLGLVGAIDELEDVALAQLIRAHVDRLAVNAQRVGIAGASLKHIGNLTVSADGDEVARNRRRVAAAHDLLHRKADGQLAHLAVDGARHGAMRVPQRTAHTQQRHGGSAARNHAQKLAARNTRAVVLRGKVSRRTIPTLTMMSGARDGLHA